MLFCTLFTFSCSGKTKNIILMVPDGMGLADVTAARISKYGRNPLPLCFETLDFIGYQRTCSAGGVITDSAAAASAWACGEKFSNGALQTAWTGKSHTGVDTMIWSSGPGSERLGRALDNTDLYQVMADALK